MALHIKTIIFSIAFFLGAAFVSPIFALDHPFPRKANYFLSWEMSTKEADELARWDVVILDMEIQERQPHLIRRMRQQNPDIIVLVYITPQEIRRDADVSFSRMRKKLASQIPDEWYLQNAGGERLSWWPGTWILNMSDSAPKKNTFTPNVFMANFVVDELLSTGLWDGVFYDNAWDNITFFAGKNIDYTVDGRVDADVDIEWQNGMKTLYNETRALAGEDIIIVGNSDSPAYADELNGMMLENFRANTWGQVMNRYAYNEGERMEPTLNIINANTGNKGNGTEYQKMRYGLTSSLLEDGYYSYDFGDRNHGQTWWFDEYNINLGKPLAQRISDNEYETYTEDLWRRSFSNGLTLVNSTKEAKTVSLGGEFEKIHGTQDVRINDGSIVSELTVGAEDGVVLLKTFETLDNVLFSNGDFARFLRPNGKRVRNGFFVFEEKYDGGVQIAHIDIDGNGLTDDLLVVTGNKVEAWQHDGQRFLKVYPYTANFKGNLLVAVGDLTGDGRIEIVVAPEYGYPFPIKVYSRFGQKIQDDWFPFGKKYIGGYSLAIGDVHTNSGNELVIGAGKGSHPYVNVFSQQFQALQKWFAYESTFLGGVNVAVGNVDGVGKDEIVVGPGRGKAPLIKVFDGVGEQVGSTISAYTSFANDGIDVRVVDVDFDGREDIIGLSSGL
jgi:hypothetical protein